MFFSLPSASWEIERYTKASDLACFRMQNYGCLYRQSLIDEHKSGVYLSPPSQLPPRFRTVLHTNRNNLPSLFLDAPLRPSLTARAEIVLFEIWMKREIFRASVE